MIVGMKRSVLITGGAKRIGRSLCLSFGKAGWNVAIHYNTSKAEAEDLAKELTELGVESACLQADFSDEAALEKLVNDARTKLGPLSCLINSASHFEYDSVESTTKEGWDTHLSVNLRAPFVLSQAFAKQVESDSNTIINILDQRVKNLTSHFITYTLSKSGLWTLTQTMAMALAPNIRVNGIGPGPTYKNEMQSDSDFERQCLETPLKHAISPDDVCRAAHFIVDTPSLTGQIIAVDSGQHLGWKTPKDNKAMDVG